MRENTPGFRGNKAFRDYRWTKLSLLLKELRFPVALVLAFLAVLTVAPRLARMQTQETSVPAKTITVHAADRVSSLIHLQDGYELGPHSSKDAQASAGVKPSLGNPLSLASADFDEDGVPDIVTGYGSGKLALYRGNVDAIYPNSREAQQRKASGQFTDEAFLPGAQVFDVPESPDVIQAGDFNADGHKDVLVSARNSNFIYLLSGTGKGTFQAAKQIAVNAQVTAMTAGEIGRPDGQTDVAVAVITEKGPQLLVYEHPEGAFKHKPEVFPLPAPATDIVLGELDGDHYSDIAVASGDVLTIIHERGQAYPWDMIKSVDIQRPPAIVETRTMTSAIAGLAIGEFGNQPGNSLALLSDAGTVSLLEPAKPGTENRVLSAAANKQTVSPRFMPQDASARGLGVVPQRPPDAEMAKSSGAMMVDSSLSHDDIRKLAETSAKEAAAKFSKMSKEERQLFQTESATKTVEQRRRTKDAFLRSISAQPSTLAQWNLETLATDAGLHAGSPSEAKKLIATRISVSGNDDLIVLDASGQQIQIVSSQSSVVSGQGDEQTAKNKVQSTSRSQLTATVTSLAVDAGPSAILPMRLNPDGLSDLVVLRNGAAQPSIVLTTPASTFVVNDAGDDLSSCAIGGTCTLRGAIFAANFNPGSAIVFNIPGAGVHTISPGSELPVVRNAVTIDGTTQPGYSGAPLIEIKGNNFQAGQAIDGLKLRASNCVVRGLAVNEFPSFQDPNSSSLFGGNGMTSESTLNSPGVGHNTFEGNYLGTDPSGTIDKGNQATGLNVFDSSNNTIGGTTAAARNVMSGNGTQAMPGAGLALTGANNNTIQGNYIGVDASGTQVLGNSEGMFLTGSGNQIGGDDAGAGNVISGNGEGDRTIGPNHHCSGFGLEEDILFGADNVTNLTLNNVVRGNKIGTNSAGNAGIGNCSTGLITNTLTQMVIGSITPTGRNLVSDNRYGGIIVSGAGNFFNNGVDEMGGFTIVNGNNIGTDISGTASIGNNYGNGCNGLCFLFGQVTIEPGDEAFVSIGSPGGTTAGGDCTGFCNLISGEHDVPSGQGGLTGGIERDFQGTVGIFNNYIGTNRSGTAALPNTMGVDHQLGSVGTTLIGGAVPANPGDPVNLSLGNLISGNWYSAVSFANFTDGSSCQANLIGTDVTGQNALPNDRVVLGADAAVILFSPDLSFPVFFLGGTNELERNVISGNNSGGVQIIGNVSVKNNYIGTTRNGTAPLPNLSQGILAYSLNVVSTIGGSEPGAANLIENNGGDGIVIESQGGPESFYQVTGNTITNNAGAGIRIGRISASDNNQIGGSSPAEQNIIAHNGGPGIFVHAGVGNNILPNSIHDNGGLGIDLSPADPPDGVTANDCLDADDGPNDLQNYPILVAPVFNGNGTVTITGSLNSEISSPYRIDFYASANADPSTYGEGENYLGSINLTTNGNGFASFTATPAVTVLNTYSITATATNPHGSTSEFSCVAGVCTGGSSTKADLEKLNVACIQAIVVNSTGDQSDNNASDGFCDTGGTVNGQPECTLRAAIQEADARIAVGQGHQSIAFNIPGSGVQTISPASALPDITSKITINATSQPGYYSSETPVIELSGASAGDGVNGLRVTGGDVAISGLAINRFTGGSGIVLDSGGVGGSHILACFIGLNPAGTAQAGKMTNGVLINNSFGNLVGVGPNEAASYSRNLLAGSSSNVTIQGSQSQQNNVSGNYFDLANDGNSSLPNRTGRGVTLTDGAQNNTIGFQNSIDVDHTNQIGNEFIGVLISEGATTNTVASNAITGCPYGVAIVRASNNKIGGDLGKARNLIGACFAGIYLSDVDPPPPPPSATQKTQISKSVIDRKPADWPGSGTSWKPGAAAASTGNTIQGNLIGVGLTGSNFANVTGIYITNSTGNQIGGVKINGGIFQGNIIGNNTNTGIVLDGGADGNTLQGNWVGLDRSGAKAANGFGVFISGSNNRLQSNKISGNTQDGVLIGLDNNSGAIPSGNSLILNLVGTNVSGSAAVGNGKVGIEIDAGGYEQIGTSGSGNLISGNGTQTTIDSGVGILIDENVSGIKIAGNRIGTDLNGATAIGNGTGIVLAGSGNAISNNTVSGNGVGIIIAKPTGGTTAPQNNIVQSNRIGVNLQGNAAIPNLGQGIAIANGASLNTIGGLVDSDGNPATFANGINNLGNTISGNGRGITVGTFSSAGLTAPFQNRIQGNLIGTDATGTFAIPNSGTDTDTGKGTGEGIHIFNSSDNLIGGFGADIPLARNIVSGNRLSGIDISNSSGNRVSGNYVGTQIDGTSALGNGLGGIIIRHGAHNNLIGGTEPNAGNTVAFNKHGVVIFPDAGCCNTVDPNLIFGNDTIGIDQGCSSSPPADDEVTDLNGCSGAPLPNDPGDGDGAPGGNTLQNYPEFISAVLVPGDNLVITYKVDSDPANSNYGANGLYIEIFKADSGLQGQTFIGSTNYTITNYNTGAPGAASRISKNAATNHTASVPGNATFTINNASSLGIQVGDKLVATATDADGNTSEFTSTNVGIVSVTPTAADGNIGGKITDASGAPLAGTTINLSGTQNRETITDAKGSYGFESVETNGFYTLTPSRSNYTFTPANRSFSLLGAHTEASFTAAPNGDHANAIDTAEFFVRQQYLDFLGREPDPPGFNGWMNTLRNCAPGDASCDRIHVSEAFFRSAEFQERGYFVYRFYSTAFGRKPELAEFTPDLSRVSGFLTNDQVEAAKAAFTNDFMARTMFVEKYNSLDNTAYVNTLLQSAAVNLSNRQALIDSLNNKTATRAQVLRQIAESGEVYQKYYNQAFVVMEYFGYLRREPDALYTNWIQVLDAKPADSRHMVEGFVNSTEYRNRFAQ